MIRVKTIITLIITFVFLYLSLKGSMPTETSSMVIGMVFTYYFNKKEDTK